MASTTPSRGEERSKSPVVIKSPSLFKKSPAYAAFNANDDELERQQSRAAKAAAQRKALLSDLQAASSQSAASRESRELSNDRIMALYQNCIKLATENKINQKNTWDLQLIDHITQIVKADVSENRQANFQKASCTLEAGVKIYSYRVDSVHSETFKVLSGLNRSSLPEDDSAEPSHEANAEADHGACGPETWKKASMSTTLESSFEAINLKKFDAAYAVDPLFHQTSAQFDEGGASGLLLYNLNIAQDFRILFDSAEVENEAGKLTVTEDVSVDVSKFSDHIEAILEASESQAEISPALDSLLSMTNDPRRALAASKVPTHEPPFEPSADCSSLPDPENPCFGPDSFVDNDADSGANDMADDWGQDPGYDNSDDVADSTVEVASQPTHADWLAFSMGLGTCKEHAWAGPKYWQFAQKPDTAASRGDRPKQRRASEKVETLNFSEVQVEWSQLKKPLKARDINLPRFGERNTASTFLPPKHKISIQDLACLYLKPEYTSLSRVKKSAASQHNFSSDSVSMDFPSPGSHDHADDDSYSNDDYGAPDWAPDELVMKPRQVAKVEVTYAKRSKQVDVRALKDTIWNLLCERSSNVEGSFVSLQETLRRIPENCPAAPLADISVHLCFISLLHLANENSLVLSTPETKDEVQVMGVGS